MTVIIQPEPEPEETAKADDVAFAAGEVVGEMRTHMQNCTSRHEGHDNDINILRARIDGLEAQAVVATAIAVDASATAQETSDEVEAAVEEDANEADDVSVIELEMPEIEVEKEEEPEKKKGWHLWG